MFSEVRNNFFEVFDREDWEKLENQFKKDVRSSGVLISVDMEGQYNRRRRFALWSWKWLGLCIPIGCLGIVREKTIIPDFVAEILLDNNLIKCGSGIDKDVHSIRKLHCLLRQEGNTIGPCIDTQFHKS